MTVPEFSVRRRVTLVMVYILVMFFGVFSLYRLRVDLYPDMEVPYVLVMTSYIGASPADIETLITRPLEEAAVSVQGLKNLNSTSKNSISLLMLEFNWGYDMDKAETDTRRRLELVNLPDEVEKPLIFAIDPSMQPIVMFNLVGDYSMAELRKIAEDELKPRLERVVGISAVDVAGGEKREIKVKLNPSKLEAYKVSPLTIMQVLAAENKQSVGGYIESAGMDWNIQTWGKYRSIDEIGEVLLGMGSSDRGALIPIRLRDIADIEDGVEEIRRILETDGKSSVLMLARKQSGANTVEAAEALIKVLPDVLATQQGLDYRIIFDQSEHINIALSNLGETAVFAVIIVFFVLLFFFRRIFPSLIVATAIPTSVFATFGVMNSLGMTLNVMSMAGLALAVGMLVDNAIVVLENVFRHHEEGRNSFYAATRGSDQVLLAIVASTLTTLAVFVPILFVPGIAGVIFKDLALTVCASLLVSLFVAITFVPMTSFFLLSSKRFKRDETRMKTGATTQKMRAFYEKSVRFCVNHRLLIIMPTLVFFALAIYVFVKYIPKDFMAATDDSMVMIKLTTEMGNDVSSTYRITEEVLDKVREIIPEKDRRMISIDVGAADTGFAAIGSVGVHGATIRIPLNKPKTREKSTFEFMDELRDSLRDVPGISYQVQGMNNMGGSQGDVIIEIYDDDIDVTRKLAKDVKLNLLKENDIADISLSMEEQKPEVQVIFDRKKMSELGLSTALVSTAITIYFRGVTASYYSEGGDEFDIKLRYDKPYRSDLSDIGRMPIETQSGDVVMLSSIASVQQGLGPAEILRKNQARYQTVAITLKNSYQNDDGTVQIKNMEYSINKVKEYMDSLKRENAESTWRYEIGGTADDFATSFMYLGLAIIVSICLVYMVMASQFESFREPFIILFTVPLAFMGVVVAFLISGKQINIASLIGCIILVGIVVNNGIIMVDAANQYRRDEHLNKFDAIVVAARTRLRPILMTALGTIFSMVPLSLSISEGSEMWSGMAVTVIGGLTSATFLTLFIVPIMYTFFAAKTITIYSEDDEEAEQAKVQIEAQAKA
ncbi:MAG: efflux RND transporter permease subunit [Bradymonadia bacterium]